MGALHFMHWLMGLDALRRFTSRRNGRLGPPPLDWSELDRAAAAFQVSQGAVGSPWDEFRDRYLPLPDWFKHNLDPTSKEYLSQQDRLWRQMVGHDAEYDPARHELTGDMHIDKCVRPGLYSAPITLAGDHLIAMGHIVKHSGLKREGGESVLEYGAGFGQIALTFSRLGAVVDTVDIDETFCDAIKAQAEWFGLPLTSYRGEFGLNPTGKKYKLILFYEAFHHARNFLELVPQLRRILSADGKIMMAGEPIVNSPPGKYSAQLPYPWGIRLDAEVGAIVRFKNWYELGFEEDFLVRFFYQMGFVCLKHDGIISSYANVYEFILRPQVLNITEWYFAPSDEATWNNREQEGRWTTDRSTITLDKLSSWETLRVDVQNHHPSARLVSFDVGGETYFREVKSRKALQIELPRATNGSALTISCKALQPRSYGRPDDRNLGIFVTCIQYI